MTFYDYQIGQKPYSKSDDLVEEAPSLTPGIDAAVENYSKRQKDESQPVVDQLKLDHPGMTWDNVDVDQMVSDGAVPQPSEDGLGVSFVPEQYFKGGESKGQWGYDFTSKTLQPKGSFDRVVAGSTRNIADGLYKLFTPEPTQITPSVAGGRGLLSAGAVGAGMLMDAYASLTGKETKSDAFDTIFEDKIQSRLDEIETMPEMFPEVRTAHTGTIQGMAEEVATDMITILGDIGIGNKMLGVTRLDPVKATNAVRKILEMGKRTVSRERGVALGELMYSQSGTPGNLSTMLKDFGFSGPVIDYLDSTEFDSKEEMAMKNVLEGVGISKVLEMVGSSVKLGRKIAPEVYRNLQDYQPKAAGLPGTQKGMVNVGSDKDGLIVQHNLSEENIKHAEEMGGLAMPSLGIVKADQPLEGFGDIALLGEKEMVKPSARNPVFSADAYTPRYPHIEDGKIFKGYTDMGNRRYAPHTLDNVVKEMRKEMRGADGSAGMYGAGALRAHLAPKFRTITEIKNARNKITSEETMQDYKEISNDKLLELANKLTEYSNHVDPNPFIANDTTIARIAELAEGYDNWSQYFPDAPPELKTETLAFFEELKNAPTTYFEAKPMRAVDVGEFHSALVPEDASDEVISTLEKKGLKVEKYKDAADKRKKMMARDDLLFGLVASAVGLDTAQNNEDKVK